MLDWQDLQVFLEVARHPRLADAARRLGVDHSTLSRRTRRFEQRLNTQLFERSTHGYRLTPAGERLKVHAELMARHADDATDGLVDHNLRLEGQIRLGVTEGFGTWVIAPLLSAFCRRHPGLTLDLLALPRVVNLSRHEADLAITIERPANQGLVTSRLCDYRLKLYAADRYLRQHGAPLHRTELSQHPLIGYVDDLLFSEQLNYLDPLLAHRREDTKAHFSLRSTSVTTQMMATESGAGLGVLPCFMAAGRAELRTVLDHDVSIDRQFWVTARQEQRQLTRIRLLWDYLREALALNQDFLMGRQAQLVMPDDDPGSDQASP
ncbi:MULTISPECIES: LysR family transcriptional regulator [Halomonas]|uniref:LysR family transcriptional regulator n=1 Tax=Halomonas TaxID=2745 RepID=UPI001A907F51|nr:MULTISPECIES: LysR family transcriptional regulator [Halomonas]MBN8411659.1 LysR family transcriptional regulator [Halomonas litopenaei]MBY5982973.1 LysR family transcriptional regulator [Halomonas sp. DP5Y7-2]MBY6208420.1 LysR family transcriptional regulator [Halomonas sp. DP3Y7-2]MBY6226891.1 LysR family transcriptional regulator [Halomonas sp. DP3Y7-1]MCA0915362.1 LysR family transcriptional regulator [Halomonas denitrificans]